MSRAAEPLQILGAPLPDSSNYLMVLQLGPRYRGKQVGDTAVLSVFHRTTSGDVSVLLERADIPVLAAWLRAANPCTDADFLPKLEQPCNANGSPVYYRSLRRSAAQFEVHDLQTTALLTKDNGSSDAVLTVAVSWNGSGRTRGIRLDAAGYDRLTQWLDDVDTHGWEGWRSGRTAPSGKEGES